MGRRLCAAGLGLFLTLALGLLAGPKASRPGVRVFAPTAPLVEMKLGTAPQPFVRRQLVPLVLRAVDGVTSDRWRASVSRHIESNRFVRPFLFNANDGESFDSLVCLIVWFVCFTLFAAAFRAEAWFYGTGPDTFPAEPWLFTAFASLMLVALLHNNYIYDPPTLCFAALTMRAVRRERFAELAVLTALFAANRETAFIVPGLTFFAWVHRGRIATAFRQAGLLSLVYLAVSGAVVLHYRHNPGSLAEDHLSYLVQTYLHKNAKYLVAAMLAFGGYSFVVVRCWRRLPATLKAVQWFVPPWIAMHILWGWPMEWRVFLEVYPGMLLTIIAAWTILRARSSSAVVMHREAAYSAR